MLSQNGRLVVDNPRAVDRFRIGDNAIQFNYRDRYSTEKYRLRLINERGLAERPLTRSAGQAALAGELDARTLYRRFTGAMDYRASATGSAMMEEMHLDGSR